MVNQVDTLPPVIKRKSILKEERPIDIASDTEKYSKALFEQTNDGVFIISFDLKFLAVNEQAAHMLGYEVDELIGTAVNNVVVLEEKEEEDEDLAIEKTHNIYERFYRRKDGSTFPVEISTSIVYGDDGQPLHIQSLVRDITARKQAEKALLQHSRILSLVSESAEKLLRYTDLGGNLSEVIAGLGKITKVSYIYLFYIDHKENAFSQFQTIESWQKPELDKLSLEDIFNGIPTKLFTHSNNGIFASSIEDVQAYPLMPHVNSFALVPVIVEDTAWGYLGLFDMEGEHTWLLAERDALFTAANIIGAATQRNIHETEILVSEARNRAIVDALPDMILRLDEFGTILDFSAPQKHPLYVQRHEVTGKNLLDIWPDQISEQLQIGIFNCLENDDYLISDITFPNFEGVYEARLNKINSSEVLLVLRDISEQVRLETMKSDFINRASHELRTPLTSALLMAELIQEGGSEKEVDEFWSVMMSELRRQKLLIDRLLMAGRLDSGMLQVDGVPTQVLPILEESISAVDPIAKKKNIALLADLPTDLPEVYGETGGLQQVFINLLNNAVKFSPNGSAVDVKAVVDDEAVTVKIKDSGIGIPKEEIPHLFTRFYRARNVTIAEIPGSGIGLHIVKSILDELNGEIHVESEENQGTTFCIKLRKINSAKA